MIVHKAEPNLPSCLVKDWQILAGRAREGQRPSRMGRIMPVGNR
ncbi:hypothetical protein LNTAR_01240 [Lentisphaera araneosa HTCC2155]|uniref:Uncharacterized protein n=1 Tax=Lentisphaera araneosa HTCC2155 TaxID=313628 RepID=A6DKT5_9BACT|nr:hypothetical protein [Lentisphaera araneosa]EDM27983.1 hypothetical protein LNTAR_01240 [Lentisphaera araneosa HTCC2155]